MPETKLISLKEPAEQVIQPAPEPTFDFDDDYEINFPKGGEIRLDGDFVVFGDSQDQTRIPVADLRAAVLYLLHAGDKQLSQHAITTTYLEVEVPNEFRSDSRKISIHGIDQEDEEFTDDVFRITISMEPSGLFQLVEFINTIQPFDHHLLESFRDAFHQWELLAEESRRLRGSTQDWKTGDAYRAMQETRRTGWFGQAIRNLQLMPNHTLADLVDGMRASKPDQGSPGSKADTVPLPRPDAIPRDLQPEELYVDLEAEELITAQRTAGNLIGLLKNRADQEKLQSLGLNDPEEWDRLRSLAKTERFSKTVLQALDERFLLLMRAQHPLVQQQFEKFMAEEQFRAGDPKMTRMRWEFMEISFELHSAEFSRNGDWVVHGDSQRDLQLGEKPDYSNQPEKDVYLCGLGIESKRRIPLALDFRTDEPTLYVEVDQADYVSGAITGGHVTFVSNGKEVQVHVLALRDALQSNRYIVHPDGSMTIGCVGNKDNEPHRNFLNTQADGQTFMQTVLRLQPKQIPTLRASLKGLMDDIRF